MSKCNVIVKKRVKDNISEGVLISKSVEYEYLRKSKICFQTRISMKPQVKTGICRCYPIRFVEIMFKIQSFQVFSCTPQNKHFEQVDY